MVPARTSLTLEHGGASEFPAPDDQSVFEHAPLLEVLNQSPGGFVGQSATGVHVLLQISVMVPSAVVQMNEADSFFRQFAGKQTIRCVGTVPRFGAIHVENMLGFPGGVHQFGHRGLHSESHFVGGDAGIGLGIPDRLVAVPVQGGDGVDQFPLLARAHALGVAQVVHGISGGIEFHSLKAARQEARASTAWRRWAGGCVRPRWS